MNEAAWISPSGAIVALDGCGTVAFSQMPRSLDCGVNELLEIIESLPPGCGLVLDRQADRLSVLKLPDGIAADALKSLVIETARSGLPDRQRDEFAHADIKPAEPHDGEFHFSHPGGLFLLIAASTQPPAKRLAQPSHRSFLPSWIGRFYAAYPGTASA